MNALDDLFAISQTGNPYMSPARLKNLYEAVGYANTLDGDLVECGTADGCSATILAGAMGLDKRVWLYDLWNGKLPDPGPNDAASAWEVVGLIGGDEAEVRRKLDRLGVTDRAVLRRGYFSETFRGPKPEKVSLLHIDSDLYDSIIETLDTFYPLVVSGGVVVLDDFGSFEGAVRAFYDWARTRGEYPVVMTPDRFQLAWIKGKTQNIDAYPYYPSEVWVPPALVRRTPA